MLLLINGGVKSSKYIKVSRIIMLISGIVSILAQLLVYGNLNAGADFLLIGFYVISVSLLVRSILKFIVFAKTKNI